MKKNLKNVFLTLGTSVTALTGFAFVVSCGETKKPTVTPETPATEEKVVSISEESKTFKTQTTNFDKYKFVFDKVLSNDKGFEFDLSLIDTSASHKDATPVKHDNGTKQFTLELKELDENGNLKVGGKTFTATSTLVEKQKWGNSELPVSPRYNFKFSYDTSTTLEMKKHFSSLGISSLKYDTNTVITLEK
ncbi:hypothetical protein [Mycoplasma sp. 480]|uniref:hypothetical protein n=1 Tax=Mycoplasma sp. 480 TaxID=3440155 RepID=UPI003F50ECCF